MILPNFGRLAKLVIHLYSLGAQNIWKTHKHIVTNTKNFAKSCFLYVMSLCHCFYFQPVSLKRLIEGLKATKRSDDDEIYKLFSNVFCIQPPKVNVEMLYFLLLTYTLFLLQEHYMPGFQSFYHVNIVLHDFSRVL